MNPEEDDDGSIAEEIPAVAVEESEEKKAITRSVHISTLHTSVTVTSQDENEDIELIKKIAIELMDKYTNSSRNRID